MRKFIFRKIIFLAEEYSLPLLLGVVIAMVWANIGQESYHRFVEYPLFGSEFTVHFLVKDIFMTVFFAVAAAEIVEAVRPGGALHPLKKACNSLFATAGGIVGPVVVYLLLAHFFGQMIYAEGWGIVTATDIAIAWLGARLIFGKRHPAVKYLLLLAVADDAVGLVIIGVFYPEAAVEFGYLSLCGLGMLASFVLREMHTEHYGFYLLFGGVPCWLGLYLAHVEPALALVLIVPFLPSIHRKALMIADEVTPVDDSDFALEKCYCHLKPIADYGLFFFGLVSAGVLFSDFGFVTLLVTVSLLAGKALGIFGFGMLGAKMGFCLPQGMRPKDLFVVSCIAGVGLTVSLFMCDAAFTDSAVVAAAKMGALFSIAALPLAMIFARLTGIKKAGIERKPVK
ncbi:MAG TPA: Na+/H+ antiporter NhaA [Clostridiales bacterium]|nr:Na+/H+ antiporter NhaA [Clostridiales bacterium]